MFIIHQWERFVNSQSQDFAKPCELFISSPNSNLLSGELATLFSGRYVEFEVSPFSYTEYCGIMEQTIGNESYKKYLQSGALPELFNLPNDEMKQNYVSSIKDTVMLKDIVSRYKVKNVNILDDSFVCLVNSATSIVSIINIIAIPLKSKIFQRTIFDFNGTAMKKDHITLQRYNLLISVQLNWYREYSEFFKKVPIF